MQYYQSLYQKTLLEQILQLSSDHPISGLEARHFNPSPRKIFQFIRTFYDRNGYFPDVSIVNSQNFGLVLEEATDELDEIVLEQFIYHSTLSEKLEEASDKIHDDPEKAQNLIASIPNPNQKQNEPIKIPEITTKESYLDQVADNRVRHPTGYSKFDETFQGGLLRGELLIFAADTNRGKSVVMSNFAVKISERNKKVCFITMEDTKEAASDRILSIISGAPYYMSKEDRGEIIEQENTGAHNIDVFFIQGGISKIEPYFKKDYDVIILDYLDEIEVKQNDMYTDGLNQVTALRNLAKKYRKIVITATQTNRMSAIKTNPNKTDVGRSYAKVQAADIFITIGNEEVFSMFIDKCKSFSEAREKTLFWDINEANAIMTERPEVDFNTKTLIDLINEEKPRGAIFSDEGELIGIKESDLISFIKKNNFPIHNREERNEYMKSFDIHFSTYKLPRSRSTKYYFYKGNYQNQIKSHLQSDIT